MSVSEHVSNKRSICLSWLGGAEETPESSTEEELPSEKTDVHLLPCRSRVRRGGGAVVGSSPAAGEAPDRADAPVFHDGKGSTPRGQTAAPGILAVFVRPRQPLWGLGLSPRGKVTSVMEETHD